MFPGHGTPTCIIFGAQRKPSADTPIRMVMTLPGGGDLRTPPEESSLWHIIEAQHGDTVPFPLLEPEQRVGFRKLFEDFRIAVGDCERGRILRHPCVWSFYDWPTTDRIVGSTRSVLRDILDDDLGVCTMTNCDEVFVLCGDEVRRLIGSIEHIRLFQEADMQRDWDAEPDLYAIFPYNQNGQIIPAERLCSATMTYLKPYRHPLESRRSFGNKTFKELGRIWYEHERINRTKYSHSYLVSWGLVATHIHALPNPTQRLFKQTNIVATIANSRTEDLALVAGIMNASTALFWAKQICFSRREAEESTTDTYYEFAGVKMQQFPVPPTAVDALRGKSNALADLMTALSRACWERGRELPSLALRKLFEKSGEAYHAWDAALPGHVTPHAKLGAPFSSADELGDRFARAQAFRDRLRAETIARQEEMDWLVYAAYGLLAAGDPAVQVETEPAPLDQALRPFRLWQAAEGDFARAVQLIPADWPKPRRTLWESRLAAIRDNEHIRRIEQPVYKRRWDEQWKVGNRWMAGPVAYAQELIDAFTWWLSEKAEYYLEHKAHGGQIALADWSAALFKDARVAAAWEIAADAVLTVEKFKFDALDPEKKETRRAPKRDDSYTAFERFFRDTVLDESVAHGIPPAVPWDQLVAKKKWVSAQLKTAQAVRGKLNVPRERFQQISPMHFVWAGK